MRVLITGGANGIGKATAVKLLEQGHKVAVFDKDWKAMKKLSKEITTYHGDVRDQEDVREVVEEEEFEVLINSAGYQEMGAIEDMPDETVKEIFETNVFGLLNFCRESFPKLRDRRGRVINISSIAGLTSMPFYGAYCGSKYSVEALTDAMRMENADTEVDVVLVEPGPIKTGFNRRGRDALEKYIGSSFYSEKYKQIVSERVDGVEPEKAANKIVEAVEADNPKDRYTVTREAWLARKLRFLPSSIKDRIKKKIVE